jgi:hypothetical protein
MDELVFRVAIEYPLEQSEHLLSTLAPSPKQEDAGVSGMAYCKKLGKIKVGGDDKSVLLPGGFDNVMVFGLVQTGVRSMGRVMAVLFQPRGEPGRKRHVNQEPHANSMISSSANAAAYARASSMSCDSR